MPEEKTSVINSEILFETDSVCVKTDRYNELINAEAKLKIVENMYRTKDFSSYDYDKVLELVFGPKGENEDAE